MSTKHDQAALIENMRTRIKIEDYGLENVNSLITLIMSLSKF